MTPARQLMGHFYTETPARDLVAQWVALGRSADEFTVERDQFGEWLVYVRTAAAQASCSGCTGGFGPSHEGSTRCESGSIASGGHIAHCTCDTCF